MSASAEPAVGAVLRGPDGGRIGTVDAVFADYLLVRTRGLLPVDLYVPRAELASSGPDAAEVAVDAAEAYRRWHRPLRSAPHA